ncbi:4-hydroxy-3-methylbut-2-enyl diphosphate reductase [Treponema bryantii]|uniref:4-hydroxy-3-methylbut-2-enyl diphosphate reductase n=2 Tax=Treponema bryantii TaxID=163 RepID=A0A1I3NIG2_9SPIR|nr:4-hydroxy-3-methylbut-2-enyl diphosphate reductase [Treponema bryantii]
MRNVSYLYFSLLDNYRKNVYSAHMEIVRASVLGFCFGVRRAVELAEKALAENPGKKVYSLGPLIHNENALKSLGEKGLFTVDESAIFAIPDGAVVIIRAHGVAPSVTDALEAKNCKIIDATCPRVKASQKMVERYSSENDYVVLTGDRNHGEVIGIAGYAGENFSQIQDYTEAENFNIPDSDSKNIILLSQTTYSPKEFEKIETLFRSKFRNLAVMNTICPATNERQEALLELCKKVDGVIVIGGKNSANTKRLYQTAAANCNKAIHVQNASEIPEDFRNLSKVGITAGASTPDSIIAEVEAFLLSSN